MNKVLYKTKYLELKAAQRKDGGEWVYAHRPNANNVVIVVPLIKENDTLSTLFLVTSRPPVTEENKCEYCLEFPAGLVGDEEADETTQDAIKKELLEETGLVADSIEIKTNCLISSGGLTSESSTVALAYISDACEKQKPVSDNGVIIKRIKVPLNEVKTFIKEAESKGYALCAQTLAGLYYIFVQ